MTQAKLYNFLGYYFYKNFDLTGGAMKKIAILFFVFLICTYIYGDNLTTVSGSGTDNVSTLNTYEDVVTTTSTIDLTNVDNILVYTSFTTETVAASGSQRTMTYRIVDNTGGLVSGTIQRLLEKAGRDNDEGIGGLVYIFDVSEINEARSFKLQHSSSVAKDTKTDATIIAIALNTDTTPYPGLNNDFKSISTGVTTSSTSFTAVTGLVTGAINLPTTGDLLVIASINSNSTSGTGIHGEWTLQKKKGIGSFVDIGSSVARTLAGTDDLGMIFLVALEEDQTTDDYYFQIAHKTDSGTIQTLNTALAAVSLGYLKGGTEHRNFPGNIVSVASDVATTTSAEVAATLSSITAKGSNVALLSQFGIQATDKENSNYSLTVTSETVVSTVMRRLIASSSDKGAGGIVGLVTGLSASTSYNFVLNHWLLAAGNLTTSDIEFVCFQLTDEYIDGALPVTLSSFSANLVNTTPQLQWTTQSEQENLGWKVYRAPSLNIGQCYLLTPDMIEGAGSVSEPTDYLFNDPLGIEGGHIYGYWIESISYSGESELFGPVSLTVPYGIESFGTPILPEFYGLKQNHPNPFNPNTTISFSVENTCNCEISIFDIEGRKLVTVFNDMAYSEEENYVTWNGEDRQGNKVSSGIYYYRLTSPEKTEMRKMLLFK